jgi:indole-3-glycerol phosphate synthase
MSVLDTIVAAKALEVARLPQVPVTLEGLRQAAANRPPVRDFLGALRSPGHAPLALIAEVKRASPSAGVLRADFDPVRIACAYAEGGASCLSVLTDERFFQGSLRYLGEIRRVVELPLLRKDFIIDERQVLETAEAGADALLLIVAILSEAQLERLLRLTLAAGLTALVEVHDEVELERALAAGAPLIGINNRDLRTFKVSLETTERLAARVPALKPAALADPLLVAESGIHSRADVERLARAGVRAMLVGEALMRHPDVGAKTRELLGRPTKAACD